MITGATYLKEHYFRAPCRLQLLHDQVHSVCSEHAWTLEAWAIMSNHYHLIARSSDEPAALRRMISKLHTLTAKVVNRDDVAPGRKVWHQFWETRLTFERSYLARLHYVHQNPVHHRIVTQATVYPWCSAQRFELEADPAFQRTVRAMPIDKLNIEDDF